MNTLTKPQRSRLPEVQQNNSGLSRETQEVMALGEGHGWDFRLLGNAPMPNKPIRLGDWLLVPAQEDSSPIPMRALARIQTIFAAGILPQGFVLVHEAPMLLPATTGIGRPKQILSAPTMSQLAWPEGFENLVRATIPVLSGLVSLATALVTFTATTVLPATLLMGALLLDPILVVVTEDGTWIEIDRWWNEVET